MAALRNVFHAKVGLISHPPAFYQTISPAWQARKLGCQHAN
jgi:hypothetical protein